MTDERKGAGLAVGDVGGLVGDGGAPPPVPVESRGGPEALRKLLLDPEKIRAAHLELKEGRFRRTLALVGLDERRSAFAEGQLPATEVTNALRSAVSLVDQQQRSNKAHLKLETLKRDASAFQGWIDSVRKISAKCAADPEGGAADFRAFVLDEERTADEADAEQVLRTFADVGVTWEVWQKLGVRFGRSVPESRLRELAHRAFGPTWQPPAPTSELEEVRKWAEWVQRDESYRVFCSQEPRLTESDLLAGRCADASARFSRVLTRWSAAEAADERLRTTGSEPRLAQWVGFLNAARDLPAESAVEKLRERVTEERWQRFHRAMVDAVRKRYDDDGVIDFGEWSYLKGKAEELLESEAELASEWVLRICREVIGDADWQAPTIDDIAGATPAPTSSEMLAELGNLPAFDWVHALHTIDQSLGLATIDDCVTAVRSATRRDQLPAGRALYQLHQQKAASEQRLYVVRNQQAALQGDEVRMRMLQHGPAIMRIQAQQQQHAYEAHQLASHLHTLALEEHRLNVELEREERDHLEGELVRLFFDKSELVKSAAHAGRHSDVFILAVIAERIYAQVFNWVQYPQNRLTLSAMRDANMAALANVFGSETSRRAVRACYVGGCGPYVDLLQRIAAIDADFAATLAEYRARTRVALAPDALEAAKRESHEYAAGVMRCRDGFVGVLNDRRHLPGDRYVHEFLFVPAASVLPDTLRRYHTEVTELRAQIETAVGEPIMQFRQRVLDSDPHLVAQISEAVRVLGLVDHAIARQQFIGDLWPLGEWHVGFSKSVADAETSVAATETPRGEGAFAIEANVNVAFAVARVRALDETLSAATLANPTLADPEFIRQLPAFLEVGATPDADVARWCQSIGTAFHTARARIVELIKKTNGLAEAARNWKTKLLATDPACDALMDALTPMLDPVTDAEIVEAVRMKGAVLGSKIVDALTTAKSAERRQRRAYIDLALEKLAAIKIARLPEVQPLHPAPAVPVPR